MLQNFEIHIGDNSDYSQNSKCAGGPFLRVDDINSYYFDRFAYDKNASPSAFGRGYVWKYGIEKFCNLEGRYMHIVADLNHLTHHDYYTMTICSLGIMGTKYVRDGDALPSTMELHQGQTISLQVPHIYSAYPIGNTLKIDLRLGSSSTPMPKIVQMTRQSSSVDITIDAIGVPVGAYELVLESFDANSKVQSTLKKDVIKVNVIGPAPSISQDQLSKVVTVG